MSSVIPEGAKVCSERAQTVKNGVDRARWRQLAEQWEILSRLKASAQRSEPAWRGGIPSKALRD